MNNTYVMKQINNKNNIKKEYLKTVSIHNVSKNRLDKNNIIKQIKIRILGHKIHKKKD